MFGADEYFFVSDLLLLCGAHGLTAVGGRDDVRTTILQHLRDGNCCLRRSSIVPRGCSFAISQLFVKVHEGDLIHFRVAVLDEAIHRLDRRDLFLVLDFFNISYDPLSPLSCVRSNVERLNRTLLETSHHRDVFENWPQQLTLETKKKKIQAFKKETSSEYLKQVVCACCGEKIFHKDCEIVSARCFHSTRSLMPGSQ